MLPTTKKEYAKIELDSLINRLIYASNFTPHKVEYYKHLIADHKKKHNLS